MSVYRWEIAPTRARVLFVVGAILLVVGVVGIAMLDIFTNAGSDVVGLWCGITIGLGVWCTMQLTRGRHLLDTDGDLDSER